MIGSSGGEREGGREGEERRRLTAGSIAIKKNCLVTGGVEALNQNEGKLWSRLARPRS